jgi:hypothetical protein
MEGRASAGAGALFFLGLGISTQLVSGLSHI